MKPYAEGSRWRLYRGDALDVLPALEDRFAATILDPPYATAGGNTNGRSSGADTQFWCYWFRGVWSRIAALLDERGCGFVFSDWRMIAALQSAVTNGDGLDGFRGRAWEMTQALVWDRGGLGLGAPFRGGYEMIGFVRGPLWSQDDTLIPRNVRAVVDVPWAYGQHENHGAEKPVAVYDRLLGWCSRPGDRILDPFAGSGSGGIAAIRGGRTWVGIEREPAYLDTAARRLAQAESDGVQQPLLVPKEAAPKVEPVPLFGRSAC